MDIKLSNILIGEDFELKIADFDSSYIQRDILLLGRGTTNYRPPELKNGVCKDTKASDIFSMGMILYVLVLQYFPFVENPQADGGLGYNFFINNNDKFWEIIE